MSTTDETSFEREATRQRHLAHNEWCRTRRDLLDQWDVELHGALDDQPSEADTG